MSWFSKINQLPSSARILLILFGLELLSALAWRWSFFNPIILLIVAVLVFYFLRRRAIYALYLPLAELIWGAMGHNFSYGFFSLRLVLWLVVIVWFLWIWFKQKFTLKIIQDKKIWYWLIIFFIIVLADILLAFYHHFPARDILYDANAYFYLLYLPIWWQVYDPKYQADILRLIKILATWLAVKTLLVFYIFTQVGYEHLINFYKWLRDTRWGEITPLPQDFYRIFSQAQIYLILAWLLAWWQEINSSAKYKNLFYLILLSAALFVSLSRSYWLGAGVAFIFLLINIFFLNKKILSWRILRSIFLVIAGSFALVLILYNLPKYHAINIFGVRSLDSQEAGISSRQALLGPMLQAIGQAPVLGHGFGYSLTYYSSDPRIKNITNSNGLYTTYAFEWGWLDMLVKGGAILTLWLIVGLILIYSRAYAIIKQNLSNLVLLAMLSGLVLIHVFSPYLNHPLGLGIFMLIALLISQNQVNKTDLAI